MALIEWKDSYSVGVKLIDEQHKKLFSHLNDLYSAVEQVKDNENLSKVLNDLSDYVILHFSIEEKYFEEFRYEGMEEHKAQHKQYTDKIESFREGFAKNQSFLSFDLLSFLEDWILNHVTIEDKKYTKCFLDHGLN
jgi:hemerythrin